jgi:hypothetical protein
MTADGRAIKTDGADTGRSCPYCRFPLKEGAEAVVCQRCHAMHHADCWEDNSGCSIVGCRGDNKPIAELTGARKGADTRGGRYPPPPAQVPTVVPRGGGRKTALLACLATGLVGGLALVVILLVVGRSRPPATAFARAGSLPSSSLNRSDGKPSWTRPTNLGGGPLGSQPSSGADARGDQFVFWRGTDGSLWEKWHIGREWRGPVRIAAAGRSLASAPSVAVTPGGQQEVFWMGTDGNLWEVTHTAGWTKPVDLGGGPLESAPTAGADAKGETFVFWKGAEGSLWDKWYVDNSWHGPAHLHKAGDMGSAPTVAVQRSGVQNVFWRARNGDLTDLWYASGWYGPATLRAGPLGSAPTAAADAQGNLFVFWLSKDGALYQKSDINGAWHGPARIAPVSGLGATPSVAVNAGGDQESLFWRGRDGDLLESSYH